MLNKNSLREALSICIPTRNRPDKLIYTVRAFYRQIKSYSVKIYISDNSDDENTMKLIDENFGLDNNLVIYMKNSAESKTYQTNFLNLVSNAKGEYLWFFGDDDLPYDYALDKVFSHLDESPDFIEVRYVGYDEKLEKVLPYWKVTIEKDVRIDKDSFIHELILTLPYNGFISFIIMKRNHILNTLDNKLINRDSNYIQTYVWVIGMLTMPQESFGYSIGDPIVKWCEDFGTPSNKVRWSKSRFLLSLEHREIFVMLSREYKIPTLLNKYDGNFQYKLIAMALDWRLRHHMSLDDSLLVNKQNQDLHLFTRVIFLFIGICPVDLVRKTKKILSGLYNHISDNYS